MDLKLDTSLDAFRQEVRAAIIHDLPAELRARQIAYGGLMSDPHDMIAWARILARRGWVTPHWPREYGGLGWSPLQIHIFEQELSNAYAPAVPMAGSHMIGPVIYTFGSDYLKKKFLPPIRDCDYIWAQGFSEPGNGSDLANLRTRAELRGDRYIVSGQKIWTSTAWACKWGFFLVRTNSEVKPQAGISFLLIDLKSPGITIRQIPMINGEADLCEVFLDNVEVPTDQLVGEPGAGWSYAKFLLDHERTASSFIYFNQRELRRARTIADVEVLDGQPLSKHPAFQGRLARLEAEVAALEWSVLRTLYGERFAYHDTAVASILKVAGSKLQQAVTELHVDLIGAKATRAFAIDAPDRTTAPLWPDYVAGLTSTALGLRASTIYGGTLQVQKNIIAKLAFGL